MAQPLPNKEEAPSSNPNTERRKGGREGGTTLREHAKDLGTHKVT
jgi:hypothetical protein